MAPRALIPIFFLCSILTAQTHRLPDEGILLAGMDRMFRQEYRAADSVVAGYEEQHRGSPAGPLFRAVIIQMRALDYNEAIAGTKFDSLVAAGATLLERQRSSLEPAWVAFFEGTAGALKAFSEAEGGGVFGSIRSGLTATKQFEKVLELDPQFADAFLGTGTYAYWKSRKTSFLNWLPFVDDQREEGIKRLTACTQRGVLNRGLALRALVEVLLDAGSYDEVIRRSNEGLARYPDNRFFLLCRATAYEKKVDLKKAAEGFSEAVHSIAGAGMSNPYPEIAARMNLGETLLALGDTTGAQLQFRSVLQHEAFPFRSALADRAHEKMVRARRALQQLEIRSGR